MSSKKLILAGSAPDTGNLGVSALCYATVSSLSAVDPSLEINILDHGSGIRHKAYQLADGYAANLVGAKLSKRFYSASSYANMRFCSQYLPFLTSEAVLIRRLAAFMDISGGDSFTDLYGENRFKTIVYPKQIALENKVPLILLPQTYGPFQNRKHEEVARQIVCQADMAFARDAYSYDYLKQLLGDNFDAVRHQQAVDVAFALPKSDDNRLHLKGLLPEMPDNIEVFGVNVSGLIFNDAGGAKQNYHISLDYEKVILALLEHILENSTGVVWLIPHVLAPTGHFESDGQACAEVVKKIKPQHAERVVLISGDYDQCDIKGVISHCDWFCGTRMHSTIASLSSMVPTAAIAYSGKFKGVFESASQGNACFDARSMNTESMIASLINCWGDRRQLKQVLEKTIPQVRAHSQEQFHQVVSRL